MHIQSVRCQHILHIYYWFIITCWSTYNKSVSRSNVVEQSWVDERVVISARIIHNMLAVTELAANKLWEPWLLAGKQLELRYCNIYFTLLLKFQLGHPKPHWWSPYGQRGNCQRSDIKYDIAKGDWITQNQPRPSYHSSKYWKVDPPGRWWSLVCS